MQTRNEKKPSERSIKFAEAGILFVLILAMAIFVGVKMTSRSATDVTVAPEPTTTIVTSTSQTPATTGGSLTRTATGGREDANTSHTETEISQAASSSTGQPVLDTDLESDLESPGRGIAESTLITYATAEAAYFEGRYDEAIELFTAYANQHPENAWGHYMLGLSCLKGDIPAAAEESFREALALKPEHLKSLVNIGRVLLELERPDEALVFVEKAVTLDPEYADAYRVLGRVYHNLGQREQAVGAYEEAILRNDKDVWSLNNLGLLFIEQGDFSAAVPPLARAVLLQDQVACFQNNLGVALERSGYLSLATVAYTQALIIDGNYEKAAVSLDRVEGRADVPGAEAIDLVAMGEEYRIETLAKGPATPVEPVDAEIASAEAGDPEIATAEAVAATTEPDEFKEDEQ